jgi:hypothetical protein
MDKSDHHVYMCMTRRSLRQTRETSMFARNVGTLDRAIRILVGLALIAGFFLNPDSAWRWAYLIGIVPLATGVFGTCGLYSLIGINTCGLRKG